MPLYWEERQTPQRTEVKPLANRIAHPTAKGFGISFLISLAYFFAFILSWPAGATVVSATFFPALILVNGALVYNYRRGRLKDIWMYLAGVAVALVLDWVAYVGLLYLLILIVLGGP